MQPMIVFLHVPSTRNLWGVILGNIMGMYNTCPNKSTVWQRKRRSIRKLLLYFLTYSLSFSLFVLIYCIVWILFFKSKISMPQYMRIVSATLMIWSILLADQHIYMTHYAPNLFMKQILIFFVNLLIYLKWKS